MTEEREIVSVSLPLAGGVFLGTFLMAFPAWQHAASALHAVAGVCALLPAAALLLLLSGRGRRYAAVAVLFGCIGLLCGVTGGLDGRSFGPDPAAGEVLRSQVRSIPFPSGQTGALVLALMTGDRSGLEQETVRVFRESGASHILALSGLHLGILYLLLLWLTKPLGNGLWTRRLRSVFLILAAGAYTWMTGAAPSLVRAFLFILLRELALLLERHPSPVRVLCGALTLQLTLDPSVVSSAGFQLSYLAMAGIVLVLPRLQAWYPSEGPRKDRWNLPRRMWEMMALSISCQLFTGPLAWLRFGTFPKYFLLTNLLAMPMTSALVILSAGCTFLSAIGLCPAWLVAADDAVARLLLQVLGIIASM
ncbi:MAG: ComEC/Rec2 family competence protein [Bacteroidales bacterium]|nr:ComEC/Rec2 family competence protein [Bacteroidales bacterium]